MARGTVKWFNAEKGYGFIEVDGSKDLFVHVSGLAPGVASLAANQIVEFEVGEGKKGCPQAVRVRPA